MRGTWNGVGKNQSINQSINQSHLLLQLYLLLEKRAKVNTARRRARQAQRLRLQALPLPIQISNLCTRAAPPPPLPPLPAPKMALLVLLLPLLLSSVSPTAPASTHKTDGASSPASSVSPPSPAEVRTYEHHGLNTTLSKIFVIGDLHGDAHCARRWVQHSGVVDLGGNGSGEGSGDEDGDGGSDWRWLDPEAILVFLGDYVDRGPQSRQVVQLVRRLSQTFPAHVVALLGNHEMELLLDPHRDKERQYLQMVYGFVHPEEFRNTFMAAAAVAAAGGSSGGDGGNTSSSSGGGTGTSTSTSSSSTVDDAAEAAAANATLDRVYGALQRVYASSAQPHVQYIGRGAAGGQRTLATWADPEHRASTHAAIESWVGAYRAAYSPGAPLYDWLASRPVVSYAGGVLFVHAGISRRSLARHNVRSLAALGALNTALHKAVRDTPSALEEVVMGSGEDGADNAGADGVGHVPINEVLHYRGMHEGCTDVEALIRRVPAVHRVVVGHTAEFKVRERCNGRFVAADSSLGRWFHLYGNMFCPGTRALPENQGSNCAALLDAHCRGEATVLVCSTRAAQRTDAKTGEVAPCAAWELQKTSIENMELNMYHPELPWRKAQLQQEEKRNLAKLRATAVKDRAKREVQKVDLEARKVPRGEAEEGLTESELDEL